MSFFNRSFFIVNAFFLLTACNPSFDETPREEQESTFEFDQVKMSREENVAFNRNQMPIQILLEFQTQIRDVGLQIPLPSEPFEIISEQGVMKTSTDFSGLLTFSFEFNVNPSLPDQEINFPIVIKALGSHYGEKKRLIKVRPWLNGAQKVLDTRYQKDSVNYVAKGESEPTLRMVVEDAEMTYLGNANPDNEAFKFRILNNLDLEVGRRVQMIINPEIWRDTTRTGFAEELKFTEGAFKVSTFLISLAGQYPNPEDLLQSLKACLPHCLLEKSISDNLSYNNKSLNVFLDFMFPLQDLPKLRYRSLIVMIVEGKSIEVPPFVGVGSWTPTSTMREVQISTPLESQKQEILSLMRNLESLEKPTFPAHPFRQNVDVLHEQVQTEEIPKDFLEKWNLSEEKLQEDIENRQGRLNLEMLEWKNCETEHFKRESPLKRRWSRLFENIGLKKEDKERRDCHYIVRNKVVEIENITFVNEVLKWNFVPAAEPETKIQNMDVTFREIRTGKGSSVSSSHFRKGFLEGKLGLSGRFGGVGVVGQTGFSQDWEDSESVEENQRSRNAQIHLKELVLQKFKFNILARTQRCLTFNLREDNKTYMYCHPREFPQDVVSETYYYMYKYYQTSSDVFLTDPADASQGQIGFFFRGENTFENFHKALFEKAKDFTMVPEVSRPSWTGFSEAIYPELESGDLLNSNPGVITHPRSRQTLANDNE